MLTLKFHLNLALLLCFMLFFENFNLSSFYTTLYKKLFTLSGI